VGCQGIGIDFCIFYSWCDCKARGGIMKRNKEKKQTREVTKEDYPKTFNLLKELEELLNDKEDYFQW
jgi:hypothetical protein